VQNKDEDDALDASIPAGVPLSHKLPLTVCNNYFSFGSDAWAALGFHLARERDPAKFSSRIHNKAFYGIQGAKDIFQRKFKNLSSMVELKVGGCGEPDAVETLYLLLPGRIARTCIYFLPTPITNANVHALPDPDCPGNSATERIIRSSSGARVWRPSPF
jgi:hypothetical protein